MQATRRMTVNRYYDMTPDSHLSGDDEGNLIQLCDRHAAMHQRQVCWAERGDEESECEFCDTKNN